MVRVYSSPHPLPRNPSQNHQTSYPQKTIKNTRTIQNLHPNPPKKPLPKSTGHPIKTVQPPNHPTSKAAELGRRAGPPSWDGFDAAGKGRRAQQRRGPRWALEQFFEGFLVSMLELLLLHLLLFFFFSCSQKQERSCSRSSCASISSLQLLFAICNWTFSR